MSPPQKNQAVPSLVILCDLQIQFERKKSMLFFFRNVTFLSS